MMNRQNGGFRGHRHGIHISQKGPSVNNLRGCGGISSSRFGKSIRHLGSRITYTLCVLMGYVNRLLFKAEKMVNGSHLELKKTIIHFTRCVPLIVPLRLIISSLGGGRKRRGMAPRHKMEVVSQVLIDSRAKNLYRNQHAALYSIPPARN